MRNDRPLLINSVVESPYFSPTKARRRRNTKCQSNETAHLPLGSSSFDRGAARDIHLPSSPSRGSLSLSRSATFLELLFRLECLKPKLIQEQVADDPWKLLIAVTLLNKTSGKLAVPAFWDIMMKWPTPFDLSQANEHELISVIRHLGTQNVRAKRLIALSKSYMQEPPSTYDVRYSTRLLTSPRRSPRFFPAIGASQYPATPISHLPSTGPYALDSYRIFSSEHENLGSDEWKQVFPTDKELIRFLRWKWAFIEGMEWTSTEGAIRQITEKYISKLVTELENTTKENTLDR